MIFYRLISILLFPFLELYLFYRVYKKKEDKLRLKERFGKATLARPEGDVIWLHAVSVGEANSALILVEELLKSSTNITILFTTTTLTSAAIIAKKLPEFKNRVIHQFLPIDSYFCVRNFLEYWQPRSAVFVESEIWPNLIFEAQEMGVKTFLVNARISKKSFKKWYFAKKIGFDIFNNFDVIFTQNEEDQENFSKLSNKKVIFFGNLKSQAQDLFCDEDELKKLKSQIGDRNFWIAASTHKGEEEIVIAVHKKLKEEFSDLLTIIIPRHPNRADEIKNLFNDLNFSQRSKKENIKDSTEIYLADTFSELGIFYRLQNFAFIGGSLVKVGGHNPFEAIKLGCAVISGNLVENFKEVYKELEKNRGCILVKSAEQLAYAVEELLSDLGDLLKSKKLCEEIVGNASKVVNNADNIAKKIVVEILSSN